MLQDVYFCLGYLFDGAVVDANYKYYSHDWKPDRGQATFLGQVFWGDDPIGVDRKACQMGDEPMPSYLDTIEEMRYNVFTKLK